MLYSILKTLQNEKHSFTTIKYDSKPNSVYGWDL